MRLHLFLQHVAAARLVARRLAALAASGLSFAIDYLYAEWNNKAAGFVGYGSAGGVRAVEHLRLVMAELQVADVRAQVMLSLSTDFENYKNFKPQPQHEQALNTMLDQVVAWGGALKAMREGRQPMKQAA